MVPIDGLVPQLTVARDAGERYGGQYALYRSARSSRTERAEVVSDWRSVIASGRALYRRLTVATPVSDRPLATQSPDETDDPSRERAEPAGGFGANVRGRSEIPRNVQIPSPERIQPVRSSVRSTPV